MAVAIIEINSEIIVLAITTRCNLNCFFGQNHKLTSNRGMIAIASHAKKAANLTSHLKDDGLALIQLKKK